MTNELAEPGLILPGGSTTNNPRVVELARECLRGGYVIQAHDRQEARQAQALGAVGVLCRPRIDQRTPTQLRQILESISILPMCLLEDLHVFLSGYEELYGKQGPSFFLLHDLSEARHQQGQNVLACVDTPAELPLDRSFPVFVNCQSLGEAQYAMRAGADGTVLRFLPDDAAMQQLIDWPAEVPRGWEKEPSECVIGIVALQGDYHLQKTLFEETLARLPDRKMPVSVRLLRNLAEFLNADAIVLPGGWSNLVTRYLRRHRWLVEIIGSLHAHGTPILAVCCGMILARSQNGKGCEDRLPLGLIDIAVDNNAVSGEYMIELMGKRIGPVRLVNAPVVVGRPGPAVEVLARLETPRREIVGVRQGNVLAFAFHEGVQDLFLHDCLEQWARREE